MADDAPGTLTVPDITIVGQPMSPDRAAFLDGLAWNPAEALRNWGRLSQDEQAYVESQMLLHYGRDFVQMFDANADRNQDQGFPGVRCGSALGASKRFAAPKRSADTNRWPSGLKATPITEPKWAPNDSASW
jgi:hypothetical protein